MSFNHLRVNIRNAMVGMTIPEALEFRKTQLERIANTLNKNAEQLDYIDEFVQELYEEEE